MHHFQWLVLLCLWGNVLLGQSEERPNILWITSEDNSPFLGCYGDTFATTPNLDRLASEGVLYENAFATAPVCAPTRFTLITGVYAPSAGTQHMRSNMPIPEFIRFFPEYIRQQGYYCTNNSKKDYNTTDQPDCWNESSSTANWKGRTDGQPFFHVRNLTISHESSIHKKKENLFHDPDKVPIPPYHPNTPEMRYDWAQYYDRVMEMDRQVGNILAELEADGLAENTIVFYFSDHGGILGRSKRFLHESGTKVPLIIRFPEKYKNLASSMPGSKTDRLVNFVDFPPTVLSLLDIPIPGYMQGSPFLGEQAEEPRKYAYSFRGRMDERIDMGRSVRDQQFRYIRNFVPYRPHLQYLDYQWRAPSMASWEKACLAGECDEIQQRYFLPKPVEELYDVKNDPHNIHNLATDPAYASKLEELRSACYNWMIQIHDTGLIPESELQLMTEATGLTAYELVRKESFPTALLLQVAHRTMQRNAYNLETLLEMLENENQLIRYWATAGLLLLGEQVEVPLPVLQKLLKDESYAVRTLAAERLYFYQDEKKLALKTIAEVIQHENLMVRVIGLNTLSEMGTDALQMEDRLRTIMKRTATYNSNFDVRAAENILSRLGEK